MYNLPNMDALRAVLDQPLPYKLKKLLADRLADTVHCGLQEYTHVVVVEAHDGESDLLEAIGFSPLSSRIDNLKNFLDCDWLERHEGWWELLYTVGNDGFAYILLIEDAEASALARLCRVAGGAP